jgi:serine-type D-Ala-D-Ala carboxypeptidase (penicillin-binding protein 5/6)
MQSLQSALEANVKILDQVRNQFKLYTLEEPVSGFAQITTAWHNNSALKVSKPVQIFGYPGMKITYSINLQNKELPLSTNSNIATLKIQSGNDVKSVTLQNTQPVKTPGFLWKLVRF